MNSLTLPRWFGRKLGKKKNKRGNESPLSSSSPLATSMSNIEACSSRQLAAQSSLKLRPKSTADIEFHYAASEDCSRDNQQHVYENLYVNERPSQTSTPKREDNADDDIYDNFIRGIFQLSEIGSKVIISFCTVGKNEPFLLENPTV